MNRAKLIHLSFRFFNSCSATRKPGFNSLRLNQVTHFSFLTQSHQFKRPHFNCISFSPNSHKCVCFSSIPKSVVEIVLSNDDWSDEIEFELGKLNPIMNHESVASVLMKLSKNPQKSLDFFRWVFDKKGFKFKPTYLHYTLLLNNLACKESLNEFWVVASEIKEKGYCLDPQLCVIIRDKFRMQNLDDSVEEWMKFRGSLNQGDGINDIEDKVVEVIGSDWSEEVESKLKELEFPLSEDFLFRVIWNPWVEPLKALKFFEWVAECRGYDHDSVTYSRMARVLAQHELIREFWDLVMRMRRKGYEIDSYLKISRSLGDEDGVKLFEFMMDGPSKLSEDDCVWLLNNLARDYEPDIGLVNRVVTKYVEAGNSVTEDMYISIHRALCKVGRFDEAKKTVDEMRNAGFEPKYVTYSQEIFGFCNRKRFEDAFLVLERMEGERCPPDIKTWTILIEALCAAGEVDQASSCFALILEKNLRPDANSLLIMLNGFLSQNKMLDAYNFLVEMVNEASVKPLQDTYKLMIDKLVEGGRLEEALNLISMMRQHNYSPDIKSIADKISKFGTVDDAKKLLRAMSIMGHSPSKSAYAKIIVPFFKEGRYTEAKDLVYASPHSVRRMKKIKNLCGGYVRKQQ